MRAEAIGNEGEGNVRGKQVKNSMETLNCGSYA